MPTTETNDSIAIDFRLSWKEGLGYRPISPHKLSSEEFAKIQEQYQHAVADSKAKPTDMGIQYKIAYCLMVLLFDLERQQLTPSDMLKKFLHYLAALEGLDLSTIELRAYYASTLGMVARWLGRHVEDNLQQALELADRILALYPCLLGQKDVPIHLLSFNDKFSYGDIDLEAFKLFCEDITYLKSIFEEYGGDNRSILKICNKIQLVVIVSNHNIKKLSEIIANPLRNDYPPVIKQMEALTNIRVPEVQGPKVLSQLPDKLSKLTTLNRHDFKQAWDDFIETYLHAEDFLCQIMPEEAKKIFLKLYALLVKNMSENKDAFTLLFNLSLSLKVSFDTVMSTVYYFRERNIPSRPISISKKKLLLYKNMTPASSHADIMDILNNAVCFLENNLWEKHSPKIVLKLRHEEAYILYFCLPHIFKLCSERIVFLNSTGNREEIKDIKSSADKIISYLNGEVFVDFGLDKAIETSENMNDSINKFLESKNKEMSTYYREIKRAGGEIKLGEKKQKQNSDTVARTLARDQKTISPASKPVMTQQEIAAKTKATDAWLKQLELEKKSKKELQLEAIRKKKLQSNSKIRKAPSEQKPSAATPNKDPSKPQTTLTPSSQDPLEKQATASPSRKDPSEKQATAATPHKDPSKPKTTEASSSKDSSEKQATAATPEELINAPTPKLEVPVSTKRKKGKGKTKAQRRKEAEQKKASRDSATAFNPEETVLDQKSALDENIPMAPSNPNESLSKIGVNHPQLIADQIHLMRKREHELSYIHSYPSYSFYFDCPFLMYPYSFSEIFALIEAALRKDILSARENHQADTALMKLCEDFFLNQDPSRKIDEHTPLLCPYKLFLFLVLKYEIVEKLFKEEFNLPIDENRENIAGYLHRHSEIFHEINHRILGNPKKDGHWTVKEIDIFVDIQNNLRKRYPDILERLVKSPHFIRQNPIRILVDHPIKMVWVPVFVYSSNPHPNPYSFYRPAEPYSIQAASSAKTNHMENTPYVY